MGIRRNGTFWVDGALRRLSSTNGKTVIAFLPTWVKQQQKHVKVQTLILFLHEKVYLKWIYFFNVKWAETSYGTRRCSPQLSGSTVKCRVRSGHFDQLLDFLAWVWEMKICKFSKTARIWHNLRKWNASLTERVEKTLLHQLMFVYWETNSCPKLILLNKNAKHKNSFWTNMERFWTRTVASRPVASGESVRSGRD